MSHRSYHDRRTAAALPRWRAMAKARKANKSYAEIGNQFGVSLWAAFKCITKFEALNLDQKVIASN